MTIGRSVWLPRAALIAWGIVLTSCATTSAPVSPPATAAASASPAAAASAAASPAAAAAAATTPAAGASAAGRPAAATVPLVEEPGGAAPAAGVVGAIETPGRAIRIGNFAETAPRVTVTGDDTISLNLEQEDLRRVFEQLGGALELNMVIDPAINAVTSVRTTDDNPLTYDDIWPLMRLLARNAGVTIEQAGNVWEFSVSQERVPTEIVLPNFLGSTTASEILQVTPLQFISRETAAEVLTPLLQDDGSILSLGARNVIGISGSRGLLNRVNALLAVIDDDPFQNQGIKLYSLRYTQADAVAEEIGDILTLIQGESGGYQVLGLPRINAVLVVGSPGRGFTEVDRWMAVLDSESQEQVEQLFVYRVKNLDALSLADTLTSVFGQDDDEVAVPPAVQDAAIGLPLIQGAVGPAADGQGLQAIQIAAPAQAPAATGSVSADLSVAIVADEDTNSLLIRSTPRDYRQLLEIIGRLDILPKQVMINAVVGQATLTEGTAYGVDWVRVSQNLSSGPARLSSLFLPSGLFDDTGFPTPGSGLVLTRTFTNGSSMIDATLNAIALENEVTLLARPTLMATNNQEGEIIVGQEIPVDSGSTVTGTGTVVANIAYRDVGIVLTITPHINDDGFINLEIFQSLSSVEDVSGGVNDNPIFTNQEITTTAVVGDQSVIALGGLIQEETLDDTTGVPFLSKIPGLKVLFSYTEQRNVRRELFVILRPQIIDGSEASALVQAGFRDSFEALRGVIEEVWN